MKTPTIRCIIPLLLVLLGNLVSCPHLHGQSTELERIYLHGNVYEFMGDDSTKDTLFLEGAICKIVKDSVIVLQTTTDESGMFEMTVKGELFFKDGFDLVVSKEQYIKASSKFDWQTYEHAKNGWYVTVELVLKNKASLEKEKLAK